MQYILSFYKTVYKPFCTSITSKRFSFGKIELAKTNLAFRTEGPKMSKLLSCWCWLL